MSHNSSRTRRQGPSPVAALFSRPYWYEPRLGHQQVTDPAAFEAVAAFEEALRQALGTFAPSDWILGASVNVVLELLDEPMLALDPLGVRTGWTVVAPAAVQPASPSGSDAARLADEVRRASGLTVDQLAALFPQRGGPEGRMSRENFHRWLSGRNNPGDANFRRLSALRHLLSEAERRIPDVRSWLRSPLPGQAPDVTPYEVLRRGALTRLWPVIAALPVTQPHAAVFDSEGQAGVRLDESLRSGDTPTPADEAEDADDWFE